MRILEVDLLLLLQQELVCLRPFISNGSNCELVTPSTSCCWPRVLGRVGGGGCADD